MLEPTTATTLTSFSRKGKERERDPARPTDLAERMIAIQRKNASTSKTKERTQRPLPAAPPQQLHGSRASPASPRRHHPQQSSRADRELEPDEFSRRLKISSPPRISSKAQSSKLFNPSADPIPMRRTQEPDSISSDNDDPQPTRGATSRSLFNHKKDDPVRFQVLSRTNGTRPKPSPQVSGDHFSQSSLSSYAPSVGSNFTLSSTNDGSSTGSAIFDRVGGATDSNGRNPFAQKLKELYRDITNLEAKILVEDADDPVEDSRVILKEKKDEKDDQATQDKWQTQIRDHKHLAEMMHNMLEISLAPTVPASLRNIPIKYNIISRIWTHAFHKLLESLRRASFTSPLALEHLQDFIYYSYSFYTGLLEEPCVIGFRAHWLECLGDLARYRMAVAAMVTNDLHSGEQLTLAALTTALTTAAAAAGGQSAPDSGKEVEMASVNSDPASARDSQPAARIDDSPSPSIGLAAAKLIGLEPETERWRVVAREWYGAGLADTPGQGKLHHHLGLLSREAEGEELRALYHFVKSTVTTHIFPTSREAILPLWSQAAQARRAQPDSRSVDLFVLLHGMLFTNIQLDDFTPTLARFIERLEIEGAEEREWTMMAIVNICALLEYGRPNSILKQSGVLGGRDAPAPRVVSRDRAPVAIVEQDSNKMDVDAPNIAITQPSPAPSNASLGSDYPLAYRHAQQLTFVILSHVLKNPTRKASIYARSTLNPYLTVMLTFLSTVLRNPSTLTVMERAVPWEDLARFFAMVPSGVLVGQGLLARSGQKLPTPPPSGERWSLITSGCAPPLDEDWCLRGMEWIGRRVYERGFWKSGEERKAEIEVLDRSEDSPITDGIIEDDDDESHEAGGGGETGRRWVRIIRSGAGLANVIGGFNWTPETRKWKVEGALAQKVAQWKEEDRIEREDDEKRRRGTRWVDDSMDVDAEVEDSEESEDDENDTAEVKELKARRRYLRNLLQSSPQAAPGPTVRSHRSKEPYRAPLNIIPGYTILVIDTNLLLASLSLLASVIESVKWTVVIPVPVIMELNGISSNSGQLGEAAQAAVSYIGAHVRSHTTSLKIQTSKGNYLTSLSVCRERVDFEGGSMDRNMDDLILKAAIWQDEHFLDRSALLKSTGAPRPKDPVKVVLLSLDRNLRLKARSRQLPAASEQDLATILATG